MDFTTHKIKVTVLDNVQETHYFIVEVDYKKYGWMTVDGQVSTFVEYEHVWEVVDLFERTFNKINISRYEGLK